MKLREQLHEAIDALDNYSLTVVFEQVQVLLRQEPKVLSNSVVPSIDEIAEMTRHDTSNWAAGVTASREDRV